MLPPDVWNQCSACGTSTTAPPVGKCWVFRIARVSGWANVVRRSVGPGAPVGPTWLRLRQGIGTIYSQPGKLAGQRDAWRKVLIIILAMPVGAIRLGSVLCRMRRMIGWRGCGLRSLPRTWERMTRCSSMELGSGSVDLVICHHTLEHLVAPAVALQEILRLLRPEGRIWLSVPYERERRYRSFDPGEPNHHLFSWNVQTLGNLVAETGFLVGTARLGRFGYDRFAAVRSLRWGLGERGYRWIRRGLHLVRPIYEVRVIGHKPSRIGGGGAPQDGRGKRREAKG
jgi:SAM-dependent methyltransferase